MKVYEAINELSQMPAGADVVVSDCMSVSELKRCERISDDEYAFNSDVIEVEQCDNWEDGKDAAVLYVGR